MPAAADTEAAPNQGNRSLADALRELASLHPQDSAAAFQVRAKALTGTTISRTQAAQFLDAARAA